MCLSTVKRPALASWLLAVCALSCLSQVVVAQGARHSRDSRGADLTLPSLRQSTSVNEHSIGLVFSYEQQFQDVASNLDDEVAFHDGLRVVPMAGNNHLQNAYDLLHLQGVDIALIRADVIEHLVRGGGFPQARQLLNSLARVHRDRVVLIAGNSVESVQDLQGRKVALGMPGSGERTTGTLLLQLLGVDVTVVDSDTTEAITQLRNGEIDAMVYLFSMNRYLLDPANMSEAKKRVRNLKTVDKVRALPLPFPEQLRQVYASARLSHEELPGLIAAGETVPTLDVDVVMAAYRWSQDEPRYAMMSRFVNALVQSSTHLRNGSRGDYWSTLELNSDVPGMNRLNIVDRVLADREAQEAAIVSAARTRVEREQAARLRERTRAVERQRARLTDLLNQQASQVATGANSARLRTALEQIENYLRQLEGGDTDATADQQGQ